MLHDRLVSALKKAGATVTELNRGFSSKVSEDVKNFYRWFQAELNGEKIDWYTSQNFNVKKKDYDGRLYVSCVTKRSPQTDSMTDCFCDSYADTIRRAVHFLNRKGY